ncbi:MAG: SPOR domain-containing protein [Flavobacteriales bacterium]|nr:SPOR domain-containing protein [Flavobacteriales bacterium]
MKTLDPKTLLITIIITLFAISIFAEGLSFKIRINNFEKSVVTSQMKDSFKLQFYEHHVDVGEFEDYFVAMKNQYKIEEFGYDSTILVAFFNNSEITIDDAFLLMDNKNSVDQNNLSYMSEQEMDLALQSVQNEEFYYTIQIGIYSEESVNRFFDFPKSVDETITDKGYFRYSVGKYKTLQDAKDALVILQKDYFENAFIIAFDNLERIPLTTAMEKEKRLLEQSLMLANQ